MRHAVIMAGGTGTRLWPLSRKSTPKQFQKLIGDRTLIQQTFDRIVKIVPAENIWVQTNTEYVSLAREQLPELKHSHVIGEPSARNTAPAICLATLKVLEEDPEAILFGLLPADHYIGNEKVFTETTEAIFKFLESNPEYVATIGITPTEPNTGLGYIKKGDSLGEFRGIEVLKVKSFHEKPDEKTAEKFVQSGDYLWNGGYYLYNGAQMVKYFEKYIPETLTAIKEFIANPTKVELYNEVTKEPIDKAISEKLEKLAVVSADMKWSDVGNWATLHDILSEKGECSEIVKGNHVGDGNKNTLVIGGSKLIATVGLKDVVVIDTEDVILVCAKDSVQDVKKIVEELQAKNRGEYL